MMKSLLLEKANHGLKFKFVYFVFATLHRFFIRELLIKIDLDGNNTNNMHQLCLFCGIITFR